MRASQFDLLETFEKHPRSSVRDIEGKGYKYASQRIRTMLDHGWLTRSPGRDPISGRKIRVYTLTPLGEMTLRIEREWEARATLPVHLRDKRFKPRSEK